MSKIGSKPVNPQHARQLREARKVVTSTLGKVALSGLSKAASSLSAHMPNIEGRPPRASSAPPGLRPRSSSTLSQLKSYGRLALDIRAGMKGNLPADGTAEGPNRPLSVVIAANLRKHPRFQKYPAERLDSFGHQTAALWDATKFLLKDVMGRPAAAAAKPATGTSDPPAPPSTSSSSTSTPTGSPIMTPTSSAGSDWDLPDDPAASFAAWKADWIKDNPLPAPGSPSPTSVDSFALTDTSSQADSFSLLSPTQTKPHKDDAVVDFSDPWHPAEAKPAGRTPAEARAESLAPLSPGAMPTEALPAEADRTAGTAIVDRMKQHPWCAHWSPDRFERIGHVADHAVKLWKDSKQLLRSQVDEFNASLLAHAAPLDAEAPAQQEYAPPASPARPASPEVRTEAPPAPGIPSAWDVPPMKPGRTYGMTRISSQAAEAAQARHKTQWLADTWGPLKLPTVETKFPGLRLDHARTILRAACEQPQMTSQEHLVNLIRTALTDINEDRALIRREGHGRSGTAVSQDEADIAEYGTQRLLEDAGSLSPAGVDQFFRERIEPYRDVVYQDFLVMLDALADIQANGKSFADAAAASGKPLDELHQFVTKNFSPPAAVAPDRPAEANLHTPT